MGNVLNVGGGMNPVGTIISFFGPTAPDGYLACDGTTYNRVDYPELADHLVSNFSDLGGDGSTTFKVPDLRGEFLRGTGTNSHTNQGSGANVGEHQDGTQFPQDAVYSPTSASGFAYRSYLASENSTPQLGDSTINKGTRTGYVKSHLSVGGGDSVVYLTSRPTNTSILYCIKY